MDEIGGELNIKSPLHFKVERRMSEQSKNLKVTYMVFDTITYIGEV